MNDKAHSVLGHLTARDAEMVRAMRLHHTEHALLAPQQHRSSSSHRGTKKHPHHPHDDFSSTVANYPQSMTKGELRLAQTYLHAFELYGDPDKVDSKDVVTSKLDARTTKAFDDFAQAYGRDYGLTSGRATKQMLAALEAEGVKRTASSLVMAHGTAATASPSALTARNALALAFSGQPHTGHWAMLNQLHPLLRFPADEAIREIEKIQRVTIVEGYRKPEAQAHLVMIGNSFAPPGYSFHGLGLALDIAPVRKDGSTVLSEKDKRWEPIHRIMAKYGFYVMQTEKGWDAPHHELPAKTRDLLGWPMGGDGWKDIPDAQIPAPWREINKKALEAADMTLNKLPNTPLRPVPRSVIKL